MFDLITTLAGLAPQVVTLQVKCGNDQSVLMAGEVHVYPVDSISINANLDTLVTKIPIVNTLFTNLAGALSTMTGKTVDPTKGLTQDATFFYVHVPFPSFSLSASAQWKEYPAGNANEWKAYVGWSVKPGVTISIDFKLDLLAVGLTYLGVPPGITNLIKQAVADLSTSGEYSPIAYLGFQQSIGCSGEVGFDAQKGGKYGSLSITCTGEISIAGIITTQVVQVTLSVSTSISSTFGVKDWTSNGIGFFAELLKWGGVQGKAKFVLANSKVFSFEDSVQLLNSAGPLITIP